MEYPSIAWHAKPTDGIYWRGRVGETPHGQYWRSCTDGLWTAVYLPRGGEPVVVPLANTTDRPARDVSDNASYQACTYHNGLLSMV